VVDVFAALADPIRRDLLLRLSGGACRVVDLAAVHPVSRPAISRHLRILRDAGLVRATEHGRERHYALDPEPLAGVRELVDGLTARRPPISDHHLDALATEVRRAVRDGRSINDLTAYVRPTPKEQPA
jgi:DNA-binding transcriptional ArsR family regulator